MEIQRLQPFPLTFEQGGFDVFADYVIAIMNSHAQDLVEIDVSSDGDGVISTPLPEYFSRYDDEYRVEIYTSLGLDVDDTPIRGDLVWIDSLAIMRPYVDVTSLTDDDSEIAELWEYESLARILVDRITGGFQYKRKIVETTGLGSDYLPIPLRMNKIIRVVENDFVVYDSENTDPSWTNSKDYFITADKSAITMSMPTTYGFNRNQSKPTLPFRGSSDSLNNYNNYDSPNISQAVYDSKTFIDLSGTTAMFPENWDYIVTVDAGWPIIPQDIRKATTMLISDLKCNKLPYINSYIKEFESDQFNVKFNDMVNIGTGNRLVDKILSGYSKSFDRLGVL